MVRPKKPVAIAESYPENLFLWSSEKLISVLEEERRLSPNALGNVVAELLVRWYFNPRATAFADYLSQKLPEESVDQFNTWSSNASPLQKPSQIFLVPPNDKNPANLAFLQRVQIKAQRRFENLLGNCDGIIPVIREDTDGNKYGCAIPFRLEPANDSDSCVIDLDDAPIPEWSKAISELNLPKIRVRLLFHSSVENDLQYTGYSLQFPVLMAYWRLNEQLPQYNPFAVVATGKIQDNRLVPVRHEEKFEILKERFDKLVFFRPGSDNTDDRELVLIPPGTSVDDVLSICNNQLVSRRTESGLNSFGIGFIKNRLNAFSNSVKKDSEKRWDDIIKNLQLFLDELDEDQYPEQYLNALLTLSFAYCHSVNTAKAHDYNLKAIEFANSAKYLFDLDLQYELLLLSIEEMVLLQDEENFEQIPSLASEIEEQLDKLDENDKNTFDLKMRYYGTLGQAHMFAVICQMEGFDKDTARDCFSKAICYAQKFYAKTKEENPREDNIDDVIRDKNYRHLWYAFFEPGSPEEQKLYAALVQETNEKQSPGNLKDNNRNFQFRQHCLSSYRQIIKLRDNPNPNTACASELIPAPNNIPYWLEALIYKYQAAVLVFLYHRNAENKEKLDDAKEMFDKAFDILIEEADVYLAMTVAAEAYRSFSALGDAQTAEQYRQKALQLFKDNNNFEFYQTAKSWKLFLDTSWDEFLASGEDFPGLHYHY